MPSPYRSSSRSKDRKLSTKVYSLAWPRCGRRRGSEVCALCLARSSSRTSQSPGLADLDSTCTGYMRGNGINCVRIAPYSAVQVRFHYLTPSPSEPPLTLYPGSAGRSHLSSPPTNSSKACSLPMEQRLIHHDDSSQARWRGFAPSFQLIVRQLASSPRFRTAELIFRYLCGHLQRWISYVQGCPSR